MSASIVDRLRRVVLAVGAAALVLLAGGILLHLGTAQPGRATPPPWPAPGDVERRARAAGLDLLHGEGHALHLHEHLSVTVDGRPVVVPAHIGIDVRARRTAAVHTHDTSGVIHVEAPSIRTFRLGQVFTEWDVRLGPGTVGPFVDGRDGVRSTVFVDGRARGGDPRSIVLGARQDIDLVVTTDGSTPAPLRPYDFPRGY